MQSFKWILYFYFLFLVSGEKYDDDCLQGARDSPIGEVLDTTSDVGNQTTLKPQPIPLPGPRKQKLRGRRFMIVEEDYMF